jgi:hypothetical protein
MAMTQEECLAYLADARKSYHALLTGTSARVVVDQNGERAEFTAANQAALVTYITQLENICGGCAVDAGRVRGPIGFLF